MREKAPLNELLKKHLTGLISRKEFEGHIFQHILDNRRRFYLCEWTREQCSDYLSWLYPRLSRAIDLYQDRGSTFDAYIGSMVYWSSREYRKRETDHSVTEFVCWKARAEELEVHSEEPDYTPDDPVQKVPNPRQILLLLLKAYFFVSDEFIARAAPAIGMETEQLQRLVGKLRERRLEREEEIRNLQERIHSQYYRCISYEKKLSSLSAGSILHERMGTRLVRARTRFASMKKRLEGIRFEASNRQIAEVLGIPKGTVDSGLHALWSKWKGNEPESC